MYYLIAILYYDMTDHYGNL